MLAFRNGAGLLDVRRATIDGGGAVTWETESSGPKDKVVVGTPAIAKGLAPSEAELLWAETAGSWHARLIGGAWDGGNAVPGAPSADALAIVTP